MIYKILPEAEWAAARDARRFAGSAVDLADGFIHFSTALQARETAQRYFHGQEGLVVLSVDSESLGDRLRWEPSRGGDLFPHLYGALDCEAVIAVAPAPLDADGAPVLGELA